VWRREAGSQQLCSRRICGYEAEVWGSDDTPRLLSHTNTSTATGATRNAFRTRRFLCSRFPRVSLQPSRPAALKVELAKVRALISKLLQFYLIPNSKAVALRLFTDISNTFAIVLAISRLINRTPKNSGAAQTMALLQYKGPVNYEDHQSMSHRDRNTSNGLHCS
jgi:hypothetical protein